MKETKRLKKSKKKGFKGKSSRLSKLAGEVKIPLMKQDIIQEDVEGE
jgi:hypothetical protein